MLLPHNWDDPPSRLKHAPPTPEKDGGLVIDVMCVFLLEEDQS